MDILSFAMQMEKDGETFYRRVADECEDNGLRRVIVILADAETRHYDTLREMKESGTGESSQGTIRTDVCNIFREMLDQDSHPMSAASSQADLYREAIKIEEKSRQFYLEEAGRADSHRVKRLLRQLAEEEQLHVQMLTSILDLVSQPISENWLERAGWNT